MTAISLTPLPLDRDSRAFRIASTLADAEFRSVVLEGRPSARRFWDDSIEVCSLTGGVGAPAQAARGFVAGLRERQFGTAGEWALYALFRGDEWWRHCHLTRRQLAPARIFYLHSFEFFRAVAPLATRYGSRVIYDAHDFYRGIDPVAQQRQFDRKRLRPFLDRLEDRLLAEADAVVTVSSGVAGLVEAVSGRRPFVIRNCHDERLDRSSAADLRAALGLTPAARLCVVVGNRKPGMAVDLAVAALSHLPEQFHLAFLGRGYESLEHGLLDQSLRDRLHVGRTVAPSEVVPTIRSADIGLVLYEPYSENYRYALPNGFFQVVAANLPVVRLPLQEIERAIGGRVIGECLTRLDPASLASAILRCEKQSAELRCESAALAQTLRWEEEAQRLRAMIDQLLARPVTARPARVAAADGAFLQPE
jgi:hypothetical protein